MLPVHSDSSMIKKSKSQNHDNIITTIENSSVIQKCKNGRIPGVSGRGLLTQKGGWVAYILSQRINN